MGENAYFVDVGIRGSHSLVEDSCVNCHMEKTPPPDLLSYELGGSNHTFYPSPDGEPVLIDPAVYLGAGEVDLAMMELFGSLPRGFAESYGEIRGWAPEYDAFRRSLYQLYYLLVHVNLFGGGYVSSSIAAAERVLSSL